MTIRPVTDPAGDDGPPGPPPFEVVCRRPWLVVSFPAPQRMASWSLNRPGIVDGRHVAWLEVGNEELRHQPDPRDWFMRRLHDSGRPDAVGMMTARNVTRYEHAFCVVEGIRADCVVTLGLNNGEHVGRRVGTHLHPLNAGTINILCSVTCPLVDAALLEASSLAAQARTVALLKAGYRRPGRADVVTGTGTDCIVMSAPLLPEAELYAGMHTAVGEAIGDCVFRATAAAAAVWQQEQAARASS